MTTKSTVAQTISNLTLAHITDNAGLLFGQCLTAVGRVGGTIPDLPECTTPASSGGIVELPTSDVAGPGFVVGAALAGRRPIFVCRYQGFMTYNLATIVNYAAKSKEMWGVPCPLFVRAIAMEGGIGPVASGSHHSMAMRMPGIKVAAPMTPDEWSAVWYSFLHGTDPVYCSEHRLSFRLDAEMPDQQCQTLSDELDIILIGISAGRLSTTKALPNLVAAGYRVGLYGVVGLKPFIPSPFLLCDLRRLRPGGVALVVDSDYTTCGAAEHIAQRLGALSGRHLIALGLDDRSAGFAPHLDNITPTADNLIRIVSSALGC